MSEHATFDAWAIIDYTAYNFVSGFSQCRQFPKETWLTGCTGWRRGAALNVQMLVTLVAVVIDKRIVTTVIVRANLKY